MLEYNNVQQWYSMNREMAALEIADRAQLHDQLAAGYKSISNDLRDKGFGDIDFRPYTTDSLLRLVEMIKKAEYSCRDRDMLIELVHFEVEHGRR